ncbi:MAG: 30S ribosomal protein S12 methylthiotransferase RimO [Anaerolineae bacterium]|jgi:ribosomal protein S12 methylthiotransferase
MSKKKLSRFYLLTLGCPKNLVDSEGMSELLALGGYRATDDPAYADVLIVNTCGFLEAAKAESIGALQELAAAKQPGQALVAAGCMVQRFGPDLIREVPGLDGLIGTRSWPDIIPFLQKLRADPAPSNKRTSGRRGAGRRQKPIFHLPETGDVPVERVALSRTGQGVRASAYLKISDGCSAPCAFCTIPGFKGPGRSRPRELILREAGSLVAQGIQELILIAQDTTAYGRDWGEQDGLPILIQDLLRTVPELRWLRVMYAYPGHVSQQLIDVMATHPQVCHYLDLPLQHGHPDTLRRMRRPHNVERLLRWAKSFRAAMPDAALRTTFIVGYPGETETEFQGLLDFMQTVQFDRVGIFTFSRERGTPAYELSDQVPEEVKQERYQRAMELQQSISLARNQSQTGRRLEVLVDGAGDGVSIARSYRDAPEIDGFVVIEEELPVGEMVPVLVTGAMTYDLLAIAADQPIMVM